MKNRLNAYERLCVNVSTTTTSMHVAQRCSAASGVVAQTQFSFGITAASSHKHHKLASYLLHCVVVGIEKPQRHEYAQNQR